MIRKQIPRLYKLYKFCRGTFQILFPDASKIWQIIRENLLKPARSTKALDIFPNSFSPFIKCLKRDVPCY